MKFQQKLLIIAVVGTLLAVFWQELNSYYLNNSGQPRFGLVSTADDASYLVPPQNFLESGVWADNSEGLSRFFQRPPGYGSIYGIFYLILGDYALIGLKILQIILFFLTILLSGKILLLLTKNEKWALAGATIMTFLPIYSGFMYYTLTEAVTPFFLIWTLHSYLQKGSIFQMALPSTLLLLVRPQLLIFPIALIILSIIKNERRTQLAIALSFLPFSFWMLRTAIISGEIQGLHPIYSESNVSLYRPGHAALTDLFRIWESDGEVFHQTIACIKNVEQEKALEECIGAIPEKFIDKTKPLLLDYHALLNRSDYAKSEAFKQEERAFVERVYSIRKELISSSPTTYYLTTPLKSAFYLLSKSQLNLTIFQDHFRGNFIMEFVRWLSIIIINLGMLSAVILVFSRKDRFLQTLSMAILTYFFYLFYFQRLNEERYLTPLLPLLLILLLFTLQRFSFKKKASII